MPEDMSHTGLSPLPADTPRSSPDAPSETAHTSHVSYLVASLLVHLLMGADHSQTLLRWVFSVTSYYKQ